GIECGNEGLDARLDCRACEREQHSEYVAVPTTAQSKRRCGQLPLHRLLLSSSCCREFCRLRARSELTQWLRPLYLRYVRWRGGDPAGVCAPDTMRPSQPFGGH